MADKRDDKGRFTKGNAPKSPGRPKIAQDFKERCRDFMSTKGWPNLEKMATDPKSPHHFKANELISAYAYGKPNQKLEHTGDEGGPMIIKLAGELEEWAK